MTAHQFAQQLLQGPDLPIYHPKVAEYSDDEEDNLFTPVVTQEQGFLTESEEEVPILLISYKS